MIKTLLISKSTEVLSTIRKQLKDEEISIIGETDSSSGGLEVVENQEPDIVLVDIAGQDSVALNLAERIINYRPKSFVILIAEALDMKTMQSAMSIGAHNVTVLTDDAKDLINYIKSVYNNESLRIKALSERQNIAWASQVITVFSPKGGLGKTTVAVNLAASLAAKGKKVALVDLDLQFGDVPVFMDLDPKDTITELMQEAYNPAIDTVRSFMVTHSSGVHVLCAPKSPEYAELVLADRVKSLLTMMRSFYDYIIIDTATSFNDITMTAIEVSNSVLFLTGMDVSILKNAKMSLNLLDTLQQKEKIKLIINRAESGSTIKEDDVAQVLHEEVQLVIPSDPAAAVNAINRGIPVVSASPNCKLSSSIKELADIVSSGADGSASAKKKNRKGLFKRN